MKFTISKRNAKLGTNLPFRTEFHGDNSVTAGDLAIKGVMIDDNELCALMHEPLAFRALFKSRPNSVLHDPLFPGIKPLKLIDTIDEASMTVFVGVEQTPIELGVTKLKGITLEPQPGGMTAMSFTAQCTPTLDKRIGELLDHLDAGVFVEISYAHKPQQQGLPLETEQTPSTVSLDGSHLIPANETNLPESGVIYRYYGFDVAPDMKPDRDPSVVDPESDEFHRYSGADTLVKQE